MSASISESPGQDRDDQVGSPGLKAEFRDAVRSWSGHLATALRDLKVVGLAAGVNLALFMAVVLGGAVVLLLSNAYPQASFPDLLVDSFHMAFLRRVAANGDGWVPVLLTFLLPLFTVLVLGEGALRAISIYLRRRTHQEEWDLMVARTFAGHTVICGAGELGRAIYHRLLAQKPNAQVVVIDVRPDILAELGPGGPNVCQIKADITSTVFDNPERPTLMIGIGPP